MKKKVLILMLVFGFLVFATNAFALAPGEWFWFWDEETSPEAVNTWTHTLENTDFWPNLDGTEPYLIINYGQLGLCLSLNFTPGAIEGEEYAFSATVILSTPDGYSMSYYLNLNPYYDYEYEEGGTTSDPTPVTDWWETGITDPDTLDAIADNKSATITIEPILGTLDNVNYAHLSGSGVVGPEPISMVLVGAGMVGLPFAGSLRRLIKR